MDSMLADIILFNKSTAMQRGLYSTTIFFITVVKMLLLCRVAEPPPPPPQGKTEGKETSTFPRFRFTLGSGYGYT